jgi:class 3 adenylate cyclase
MTPAPAPPAGEDNRTKRAWLAQMRHELRTPINAILGYSELLLEDAEDDQAAWLADLRTIHAAGEECLRCVGQVLDAEKIEAAAAIDPQAYTRELDMTLRTPVTTVIGCCDMLIEEEEELAEAVRADLDRIRDAGRKLLGEIDDLVALRRAGIGETVDLSILPAVAVVRETFASLARAEGLVHPDQGGGRVLVVEDNETNRDLLQRRLERDGHRVSAAENGAEALAMLATEDFDVILLDLMMPVMNGLEVLARLKGNVSLSHVPVIMLSALDEIESVVRCIELGAEDYLTKPFNPVVLRARLGACLEKKRLRDREQAYVAQLRTEREKSERLLLNVLPHPIAERLKAGEEPIADFFENVTVLFADIVGFTPLAATMSPAELVLVLDTLFNAYDALLDHYGLEKVKTIGDSYMAAAGLPEPRPDHAQAAAAMALDMIAETHRLSAELGLGLAIRSGLHSGPLVAGVIGSRKFIYDLWGDTVNTASRMESHGEPGAVHVSEATWELVKDHFAWRQRGVIAVKGKGQLSTYWLTGRLD